MKPLPFVDLVPTRGKGDCGICALAMLVGASYEDVLVVLATKTHPRPHRDGLMTRQLIAGAKQLGVALTLKRTWDEDEAVGLLCVEKLHKQPDEFIQHLVLLKFGLIFDCDGTCWEIATYYAQHDFKPVSLLVPEED